MRVFVRVLPGRAASAGGEPCTKVQVSANATNLDEMVNMDNEKLLERIHALETAQATQMATTAGMEATQGAVQAGNMATTTAMTTGTMTTMAAGSIGLIVGIFLGLAIRR
jgi:hypothetical protein